MEFELVWPFVDILLRFMAINSPTNKATFGEDRNSMIMFRDLKFHGKTVMRVPNAIIIIGTAIGLIEAKKPGIDSSAICFLSGVFGVTSVD
tara:strand:+ start:295 stop:567 length:273 start_codon:yes stop_codon:yes gene_type:complete